MNREMLQIIVRIYNKQFPGLRLSDLIRIAEDVGDVDDTLSRGETFGSSLATTLSFLVLCFSQSEVLLMPDQGVN